VVRGRYRDGVVALMTVLLCIGGLLIAGALVFLMVRFAGQWALLTLRRHPPTPIGSWRGGARVAVEAYTEYGPAGRQIAPATGEDCAWYHVRLIREPTRRLLVGDGEAEYDELLDLASPAWPAIADPTGRIEVDPRMLDLTPREEPVATESVRLVHRAAESVALPPIVPGEVIDDLRGGERLVLTEVRLPHGRRIFALGRPSRGALVPSHGSLSIFTSDDYEKILAERSAGVRVFLRAALAMLAVGAALAGGSAAALAALL